MNKRMFKIVSIVTAMVLAVSGTAFAATGSEYGPGVSGGPGVVGVSGGTGVVTTTTPASATAVVSSQTGIAGSNTAYNGSTSYEAGRVQNDPITGLLPDVHVQFKTGDGNLTGGFTTNMDWFNSPMEGFSGLKIRFENSVGDVFYRAYTEEHGWTKWAMNEMDTEWFNDAAKITAVQMRIKGHTRNLYDFYYRVELNDGTVLDWAHDGQSSGTIGTGRYIQKMQVMLWKHDLPFYQPTANHFVGANYEGIVFDGSGLPHYQTASGAAYTGWAYDTYNNKYYFVDSNPVSDWQYVGGYKYYFDASGKVVTDLEPIMGLPGDYIIKVNKEMKCMTIYTKDGDKGYIIPYKVFLCTIGSSTPEGEFKLYEPHRWKFMHDDIYVQYLMRYKADGFCIHSIIYRPVEGSYNLIASTYNQLGKNYSDGCIRLLSGDAAWLYTNCGADTKLEIYYDYWVMGPFDRPAIEQAIPDTQRYDPTDPVVIADMQNHTGPFASGTYNGEGFETPVPEEMSAEEAAIVGGEATVSTEPSI
ncbi:MAG: L,D-transpeptidase family protein [Lachnospiraceae bacterium]|nr:L,D-transpeptidase family protein [Lachnospiraceae bacterium]